MWICRSRGGPYYDYGDRWNRVRPPLGMLIDYICTHVTRAGTNLQKPGDSCERFRRKKIPTVSHSVHRLLEVSKHEFFPPFPTLSMPHRRLDPPQPSAKKPRGDLVDQIGAM